MSELRDIAIVIPVYEATASLRRLVEILLSTDVRAIYVVDDGSTGFTAADCLCDLSDERIKLSAHDKNYGKGRALKTAFQEVMAHGANDLQGVITVDADGQHLFEDVLNVARVSVRNSQQVVIGSRTVTKAGVPARSKFGNVLTRAIFKLATGVSVRDTQSGLRFLPYRYLAMIYQIPGERYEYELKMLTEIAVREIGIIQPEISTTYINGNASSHFRPLVDSVKIYAVFIRYCASSLLSALADLVIFALMMMASYDVVTATFVARAFSASLNFYSNRTFAFAAGQQKYTPFTQIGLYMALAFFSASVSAALLQLLTDLSIIGLVFAKAVIDIALFFFNFTVQKLLIFRARPQSN